MVTPATRTGPRAMTPAETREALEELRAEGFRLAEPAASDADDIAMAGVTECPGCGRVGMAFRAYRKQGHAKRGFCVCDGCNTWIEQ